MGLFFCFPGLANKITEFKESIYFEKLRKSQPRCEFAVFPYLVEIIDGTLPVGVVELNEWWEDSSAEKNRVNEIFTQKSPRCGVIRPYNAYVKVAYNSDKTKV